VSRQTRWPHLLQTYFSVALDATQQQIWEDELLGETNETMSEAIRWASLHWKRPEFCQINLTTMQAWLYKSKHGTDEQKTAESLAFLRKIDALVAEKCREIDATPDDAQIRVIIESVDVALRGRLAHHAEISQGYDWFAELRNEAKCAQYPERGE
jgi:hypothetical protein